MKNSLFAIITLLLLMTSVAAYAGYSAEQHFTISHQQVTFTTAQTQDIIVTASDDIIYQTGYYALASSRTWTPFNLTGTKTSSWITNGQATASISVPASTSTDNYILIYSCSKGTSWDCHEGWQLRQLNTTVQEQDVTITGVSASGQCCVENVPGNTLDGIIDAAQSAWSIEGDNEWITYELSDTATVSYVRFAFAYNSKRNFDVQVSNDSSTWTTVLDDAWSAGNMADTFERFNFQATPARYVRFLGHGSETSAWNAIVEADINGFAINLNPTTPEEEEEETDPDEEMIIVFAEDFENIPNMAAKTLMDQWQITTANYKEESNALVDVGGIYGKVWESHFHEGRYMGGNDDGYAFAIPLGDSYDEMWLDWDFYADPAFDPYSTTGKYSGKMMPGLGGGNDVLTDGKWTMDQSADGNGWVAHFVWGSQYALRGYYYDQVADGQTNQLSWGQTIPRGRWLHGAVRIKMNTPGIADGIYEIYIDGQLQAQTTTATWRSAAQGSERNKIEFIFPAYFFGGGGTEYICPKDNYVRMDNLIAYYYTTASSNYLSGPAPRGHTIPIVRPEGAVYVDKLLYDETFTATSGTIKTHYVGAYPPYSYNTFEKRIERPTGPIRITFNDFNAGWDVWPTMNSWTKVYAGTGENKQLLHTFDRENTPSGTYTIDSNTATIAFYPGWSHSEGWTATYTS